MSDLYNLLAGEGSRSAGAGADPGGGRRKSGTCLSDLVSCPRLQDLLSRPPLSQNFLLQPCLYLFIFPIKSLANQITASITDDK